MLGYGAPGHATATQAERASRCAALHSATFGRVRYGPCQGLMRRVEPVGIAADSVHTYPWETKQY